jgi:CRP-like cAMP-binding protein
LLPWRELVFVRWTPLYVGDWQEIQMNAHLLDYLVHFSNVLMLASYSVRDILWLRWFAVAAAITNIPYFLLQSKKLWPPVIWALVFTAINLYQILRIYFERRPVVFSEEEQRLYNLGFSSLRPREFVSLLMAGEWKNAAAGDAVLVQGDPVASICIPISGGLVVRKDGKDVMALKPGHLIGTALALTGQPSPIAATFTEAARYFVWPLGNIRAFLDKRPDLRIILQNLVNHDLAAKLEELSSYLPGL